MKMASARRRWSKVDENGIGTPSVGKSGKKEQQRVVGGAKWRASSPFSVGKNGGAEWGRTIFALVRRRTNIFGLFIQNSL
jgi:hypothetical protein